jgi:uncharacterized transporter YbjL
MLDLLAWNPLLLLFTVIGLGYLIGGINIFGFKKRGLRFSLITARILAVGAVAAILIRKFIELSAPSVAGLFCGGWNAPVQLHGKCRSTPPS